MLRFLLPFAALAVTAAPQAVAQGRERSSLDFRAGLAVPTLDIADALKTGLVVGVGLVIPIRSRWQFILDGDLGQHPGKDFLPGVQGPDATISHLLAKAGYLVTPGDGAWRVVLNAGVGLMRFDFEGGNDYIYPALNVGAKITHRLSENLSLVLSPQGDIAFTQETETGTSMAWVWPFSAGIRLDF